MASTTGKKTRSSATANPIGVAQGQWIEKTQPDGAEIALINGDLATNYALLMQKGQKSVLQKDFDSGKFKLVADKGAVNWILRTRKSRRLRC